jgi:hypothetical protein
MCPREIIIFLDICEQIAETERAIGHMTFSGSRDLSVSSGLKKREGLFVG